MKKFIVIMMLLLPLGIVAQEMKIAFVNTGEVYNLMPEAGALETEMAALRTQAQNTLKALSDEYSQKYSDLMAQQDSLSENMLKMKAKEIEQLAERMDNFQQASQQEIQEKSEKLFTPIREKLFKAINEVGEENGYTYIIDPQVILYKSSAAIDATEKVKVKLGLQ